LVLIHPISFAKKLRLNNRDILENIFFIFPCLIQCSTIKEIQKPISTKKDSASTISTTGSSSLGHLCNIKEEVFEDAIPGTLNEEEVIVDSSNDTNEDSLYYFA
jgi:hypothetical protein